MSYVILGRAIKNEYLALGTLFSTAAVSYLAMSGGKKESHPKTHKEPNVAGASKEFAFGAGSSEEDQFIQKFIKDEEAKSKH